MVKVGCLGNSGMQLLVGLDKGWQVGTAKMEAEASVEPRLRRARSSYLMLDLRVGLQSNHAAVSFYVSCFLVVQRRL